MPDNNQKQHIRIEGYTQSLEYKYPNTVVISSQIKDQNRAIHGNNILGQLQNIREQLQISSSVELPEGIVRDNAIYVEFISEWGYPLKFESLESTFFKILNIKRELRETDGVEEFRYTVALMMTNGGISKFIQKTEDYLNRNIINKAGEDTGNPKNYSLINNIQIIQRATLKSFWTDAPEIPFPDENESVWWSVWFRKASNDDENVFRVFENLIAIGAEIGPSELVFAEHRVRLVRATALQLSQSLLLLDNLAELRKPQETCNFICHRNETYTEQTEWLSDLISRTNQRLDENSVLICLLDSGVNNQHPLISPFLPDNRLYSYKPNDWGVTDSWPNGGHGTGVAGLSLYGDLIDVLASRHEIAIFHGLESFKIIQNNDPNNPNLYGAITEYAASIPIVDRPNNPRIFCMTITDEKFAFRGRPSAWSAAIDKISFGTHLSPISPQLFIVSAGNVEINAFADFPSKNYLESVHDPAQSYNALTVGSYTRKDRIEAITGYRHLAQNGGMAPSNSTSTLWDHQWPLKPDIVMEGGNLSTNGTQISDHQSLKLLTTDKDFHRFVFLPFGDTSGAAALAAKMAAELRTAYPNYWPETIRALMVHSAEWTDTMLDGMSFQNLNERERINLLRSVGYGVPLKEKALFSANNSLSLIAEREIQPYQLDGSTPKSNHYHLFELPWPIDVLRDTLFDQDVTLKLTLSYFIEPNPGSRRYANNFQYHSHSLDFAVIKPEEALNVFKRRISSATDLPEDEINGAEEPWMIKRVRSRGSIKKDFITMSGAEIAARNIIAVYPKSGWYKTRKKLEKANSTIRYSLIVTIETPSTDVDIYTPVLTQIENLIF
jgi:hypothetical protein